MTARRLLVSVLLGASMLVGASPAMAFTASQAARATERRVESRYPYQTKERLVLAGCHRHDSIWSCHYQVFGNLEDGIREGEEGEGGSPILYHGASWVDVEHSRLVAHLNGPLRNGP